MKLELQKVLKVALNKFIIDNASIKMILQSSTEIGTQTWTAAKKAMQLILPAIALLQSTKHLTLQHSKLKISSCSAFENQASQVAHNNQN